jgi:hypothetical protein
MTSIFPHHVPFLGGAPYFFSHLFFNFRAMDKLWRDEKEYFGLKMYVLIYIERERERKYWFYVKILLLLINQGNYEFYKNHIYLHTEKYYMG